MSSRKVLAVIAQDPILQSACDRIRERKIQTKQKLTFIQKQIENAIKEADLADEPDEGLIEARLREIGCLKQYNKETHHICIRHEEGSIDLHENESDHPLAGLFEILGKGRPH